MGVRSRLQGLIQENVINTLINHTHREYIFFLPPLNDFLDIHKAYLKVQPNWTRYLLQISFTYLYDTFFINPCFKEVYFYWD